MDLDDLGVLMDKAKRSVFRLETLPQYLVPQEAERFAAFRAGKLVPRTLENSAWLVELQQIIARGIRWYRVHVLDFPLCEYSRFEVNSYRDSQAMGQETFLADRAEHSELADMHEDFWLMDDDVAVRMVYDEVGHFLRPERIANVKPCVELREIAMKCAEPLDDFISRRNPKLTV
jgi:uncharacterized protein DUF6879